jgi:transketolase
VVRPGDANETAVAWRTILERTDHPAGLCLTRQNIPVVDRADGNAAGLASAEGTARGGYILADAAGGAPDVILIATGSEVQIALAARDLLQQDGTSARVVSMPCVEWFEEQEAAYREQVLPPGIRARVSVEAGIALGWRGFIGDYGEAVSLEHFGASASAEKLYEEFGFTAQRVAEAARSSLSRVTAAASSG